MATPAEIYQAERDAALTPEEQAHADAELASVIAETDPKDQLRRLTEISMGGVQEVASSHSVPAMVQMYAQMMVDADVKAPQRARILGDLWAMVYGTPPKAQEITITQDSALPLLSPDQTRLEQPKTVKPKVTRKRASRRKAA